MALYNMYCLGSSVTLMLHFYVVFGLHSMQEYAIPVGHLHQ